jgi:hypothetical protein
MDERGYGLRLALKVPLVFWATKCTIQSRNGQTQPQTVSFHREPQVRSRANREQRRGVHPARRFAKVRSLAAAIGLKSTAPAAQIGSADVVALPTTPLGEK